MGRRARTLAVLFAAVGFTLGAAHSLPAAPADLDPSFGSGGKVVTDFNNGSVEFGFALAIQSDGKIIVAGGGQTVTGLGAFALARYNTDGSLDPTFGIGGKVTADFGSNSFSTARAVSVQPDGKIVAAGFSQIPIGGSPKFALARFNGNGTLDAAFGSGGRVMTDFGGSDDEAFALALQPDGRIVVAGSSTIASNRNFALARYTGDGSLDPTFGNAGKVTTDFRGSDQALAVALQADGKIVAAGQSLTASSPLFVLGRYNAGGSLDSTFGNGGKVTAPLQAGVAQPGVTGGLAVQPDGKIVIAGSAVAPGGPCLSRWGASMPTAAWMPPSAAAAPPSRRLARPRAPPRPSSSSPTARSSSQAGNRPFVYAVFSRWRAIRRKGFWMRPLGVEARRRLTSAVPAQLPPGRPAS